MGARAPSGTSSTSPRTSLPSLDCGTPELEFRRSRVGLQTLPSLGWQSARAWAAELPSMERGAPVRRLRSSRAGIAELPSLASDPGGPDAVNDCVVQPFIAPGA
eukprot:5782935-Alexandrium_andersonii.AAC.1